MRRGAVRRQKKIARKTASETYVINSKYLGVECPKDDGTQSSLGRALTWYNSMCDNGDAREYARDFLSSRGQATYAKRVGTIPDNIMPLSSCWLAKLYLDGWNIDAASLSRAEERILKAIPSPVKEKTNSEEDKKSVHALMMEKVSDVIGDIEVAIDASDTSFSMYEYLTTNAIPQRYVGPIVAYYTPLLTELNTIKKDEQLKEAYSSYTAVQIRDKIKLVTSIIADLERWNDNQKKTRAPRKKRVVSADKKVAKLSVQMEDANLKLQSVKPASIIGAQELYVYNTKYGILSRYVALDRGGFDIKGQTIQNFDENQSEEKRIGRVAETALGEILKASKTQAKKIFMALKAKSNKPTGRLNTNTILLKTT